tara:strand:+ start:599 stop:706 length:108 start_codon:yes stop_codon:yes gene_type:complete
VFDLGPKQIVFITIAFFIVAYLKAIHQEPAWMILK